LFSFLFVALGTQVQAQKAVPKPKVFTNKLGKYSINFPKTPTEQKNMMPIENMGECELVMHIAEMNDNFAYFASYIDFPKDVVDAAVQNGSLNIDDVLDGTVKGVFESQGAAPESQEFTTVQKHRALFAKGKSEAFDIQVLVLLVDNRLYQIMMLKDTPIEDKESKAFFNSFKLLK
jgi:hypothetical protein